MMAPERITNVKVSAEELVALSEEIAALSRAGLPLASGMASLSLDLPGRMRRATASMAERIERGESLAQTMASIDRVLGPMLEAVVEAGLRSGRLASALEELASVARMRADLRRTVALALVYPVLVVVLALGVLGLFVLLVLPTLAETAAAMRVSLSGPAERILDLVRVSTAQGAIGVLLVLAALGAVCAISLGRPIRAWQTAARPRGVYGSLFADVQAAFFAGLMRLMIEHQVPLPRAVCLAGRATGNRRLSEQAQRVARRLELGEPLALAAEELHSLPPLFVWSLGASASQNQLRPSLATSAARYAERAARDAKRLHTLVPIALVIGLAGMATLICALILFYPWAAILEQIGAAGRT